MSDLEKIEQIIIDTIIDEWTLKGHNVTGSFIDSLTAKVKEDADGFTIDVDGNTYGFIMNKGVPASNIPYSGRSSSGGTSKYITGLKNYVQKRMGISDERKALGIAFAIATKHKKDGIIGSGFLDEALLKLEDKLDNEIMNNINKKIYKWL